MGQVNLLKIGSAGLPQEMAAADEITLTSFTVTGVGGPVLSIAGLDMNGQSVSDCGGLAMTAVDDLIAGIENQNLVDKTAAETISGAWDFATGEFTFPNDASAVPAEGDAYWSDADNTLYVYDADSATWIDLRKANEAAAVDITYTVNDVGDFDGGEVVYISEDDGVSKAIADGTAKAYAIGFNTEAALDNAPCEIRVAGIIEGVLVGAAFGTPYFLSDDTAGGIETPAPSGSGKDVVRVGYAKNATDLHIDIQYIGKRA